MNRAPGPRPLSAALSELVSLRGLARTGGPAELASVWKETAGDTIAQKTRVLGMKRGVLQIAVSNSPLLSELASFHKESLLRTLQQQHGDLKIRDLKFRLKGDLSG
jgi:hypothetical protein